MKFAKHMCRFRHVLQDARCNHCVERSVFERQARIPRGQLDPFHTGIRMLPSGYIEHMPGDITTGYLEAQPGMNGSNGAGTAPKIEQAAGIYPLSEKSL
ncbi:MAG: hypothetical protein AMXMBFR31_01700 [Candidatus Desulfobacillus denitrificans]